MSSGVPISAAVEGLIDEAVVRRLIEHVGGRLGTVYGKNGKPALRPRVQGYNNAARRAPWIVLVDLDDEYPCAPPLCQAWVPDPSPLLCFRVAVRQVEAWLLADHERLAEFLGVPASRVPRDPEALENPKRTLVDLAQRSRRRSLRDDIVPRVGSGRSVGPAYASRIIEFVDRVWRPAEAAHQAESLGRAITCLERLVHGAR